MDSVGNATVGAPNLSSFFPSASFFAKLFVIVVIALNWPAIPFVWHLRVFGGVILVRLKGLHIWFDHFKRRAHVEKLSPIGVNPFEHTVTFKTTVGFSDTDYNGHLSNSAYAKNFDYARMRALVTWYPSLLEAKGWLGLGASHYQFLREIPWGTEYEIRMNMVGWEDKWIHIVAQFVTYPKKKKSTRAVVEGAIAKEASHVLPHVTVGIASPADSGSSSPQSRYRKGSIVDSLSMLTTPPASPVFSPLNLADSYFTSPTPARSPSAESLSDSYSAQENDSENDVSSPTSAISTAPTSLVSSPEGPSPVRYPKSLPSTSLSSPSEEDEEAEEQAPAIKALPPIPTDAVLHCVHVSSYCFKSGRITIPPRVALITSGYGDASKGRWERVQTIRNTRSPPPKSSSVSTSTSSSASASPTSRSAGLPPPGTSLFFTAEQARASQERLDGAGTQKNGKRKLGGLRSILQGGWKDYENEGLWDLPEYEERRLAGVRAYGSLRTGLDALRD